MTSEHKHLIKEYSELANRSELSELEAERMSELLEMAQSDDVLSLLFNEIDCSENPKINNSLLIDNNSSVNFANDNFLGGFGDDTLDGGAGDDTLNGDVGNDILFGGYGNDSLYCVAGKDRIYGEDGDDYPPVNHSRNYPRLCQVTSEHKHLIKEYSELENPPVEEENPPVEEENSPVEEEEPLDETDSTIIDASGGNKTIVVEAGEKVVITNLLPAILEELDTVQFISEGLEAKSLLFLQEGENLVLSFEGDTSGTRVVLQGVKLEDIDNIPLNSEDNSAFVGNIFFDGDDKLVDGSGDDLLDGETGNNTYTGGASSDQFMLSEVSSNLITDFTSGEDQLILVVGHQLRDGGVSVVGHQLREVARYLGG